MKYWRAYTDDRVRHRHHKLHSRDTKGKQSWYHDLRSHYVPGGAIKGNEGGGKEGRNRNNTGRVSTYGRRESVLDRTSYIVTVLQGRTKNNGECQIPEPNDRLRSAAIGTGTFRAIEDHEGASGVCF